MRRESRAWPTFAVILLIGMLPGLRVPTAHANADDDYLWELNGMGITPATSGKTPAQEIAIGHAICVDLQNGVDPTVMVTTLQRNLPRLTREDAQLGDRRVHQLLPVLFVHTSFSVVTTSMTGTC